MKKAYIKDIIKEIKRTKKRYISIIAIVMLGVALYVGVNTSSPDMLNTYNKYLNDYNVFDLNLISTVGFDEQDIETIKNIENIDYIEPVKSIDTIIKKDNEEEVIQVTSISKEITDTTINKVQLVQGNYPTKNNEIILDNLLSAQYKIGDNIEFVDCNGESLENTYAVTSYTIVGFANSPLYIGTSRGNTSLGDGTISGFALVLQDAFSMQEYTNIYARVDTENKNRTSDEYIQEIEKIQDEIKLQTETLANNKHTTIYIEGKQEIEEAKQELENARNEITSAEEEIANAKIKLENSQNELQIQKQNYNNQISEHEEKIQEAEQSLNRTKNELDEHKKTIEEALNKIIEQEESLLITEKNILESTEFTTLNEYLQYLKNNSAEEENIEAIEELVNGKSQINTQKQMLQQQKEQIELGINKYNEGVNSLNIQKQELEQSKNIAQSTFKDAERQLNTGWTELIKNENTFNEEKQSALQEISEAEIDIDSNEKKLEDLKVKIYVLNLETNEGYVTYKSDCDSIATIGKVFPIIFFLVAALVSLTAMTRMVEENRGNIGTYKSLGYSRIKIASKYLTYSITATSMGIIIGTVVGSYTLPWVVAEAYRILYNTMPSVLMSIHLEYAITAGIAAFLSTTIATMFACYRILRATPAKLMRPKSPKEGKKIFLERISFVWKHFSFTQKITARNVFRYKKRLFMTIIGIAGCTGLIFTGFGLKGSISSIVKEQYGIIRDYDFEITLKNELDNEQISSLNNYINNINQNMKYSYLRQQTNDVIANEEKQNAYIIAVDNQEEINDFVAIQNRKTKEKIQIEDNGVIITEKLSKLLNVNLGDEISIKIDEETSKNVRVTNITENYINHYIYMNKSVYNDIFEEEGKDNHIYIKLQENITEETDEEIAKYLLQNDNISQVLKISTISQNFENMIKSLNMVVVVLIVCAGLLAFVVLYNLNSINIEERKRELATIKLLGFYNKELSSYVFRENIILTIIGAALGLILGIYLHYFVISTAEMDIVMFGRAKTITTYIISFCMTIVFATVINLIMNKELKKIDMIESLKSVE